MRRPSRSPKDLAGRELMQMLQTVALLYDPRMNRMRRASISDLDIAIWTVSRRNSFRCTQSMQRLRTGGLSSRSRCSCAGTAPSGAVPFLTPSVALGHCG